MTQVTLDTTITLREMAAAAAREKNLWYKAAIASVVAAVISNEAAELVVDEEIRLSNEVHANVK